MTNDHTKTSKKTAVTLLSVVALASLGLGLWLSQHQLGRSHSDASAAPALRQGLPKGLNATVLPHGKPLAAFKLTDINGKPFNRDRLRGKWSFVFFGYTHCPDVCPLTLSILNGVYNNLEKTPADLANMQIVFISVDPKRDSIPHLKQYVHFYNKHFMGATGTIKQINNITRQLGVNYSYTPAPKTKAGYIVSHSAQILLIDPEARERAVFSPPHKIDAITTAFRKIRHYYEGS